MFNNRALQFFFFQKFLFNFSDNQMKAWAIYLFFIKWKWNPDLKKIIITIKWLMWL